MSAAEPGTKNAPDDFKEKTEKKVEDEVIEMTKLEKLQSKQQVVKDHKKKSMDAWGDTGE